MIMIKQELFNIHVKRVSLHAQSSRNLCCYEYSWIKRRSLDIKMCKCTVVQYDNVSFNSYSNKVCHEYFMHVFV